MPRPRKDRQESYPERSRARERFRQGHTTGWENVDRGSGRDPSIPTRRRTPNADERAGVRSGERRESLRDAEAKRFGRK